MTSEVQKQEALWQNVQGLVVRGYSSKAFAAYVLFSVLDRALAVGCLRHLLETGRVNAAADSAAAMNPEACVNIAFTASGLEAMGLGSRSEAMDRHGRFDLGMLKNVPVEFREGADNPHRRRTLRDGDHPWEWRDRNFHGMFIVMWGGGSDAPARLPTASEASRTTRDALEGFEEAWMALFGQCHVQARSAFETRVLPIAWHLRGYREHFGFRDGISQPRFTPAPEHRALAAPSESERDIRLGEFLLGHVNESDVRLPPLAIQEADIDARQHPLSDWLPRLGHESGARDFGADGSFLVFRQYRQHVERFERFLDEQADRALQRLAPALVDLVRCRPQGLREQYEHTAAMERLLDMDSSSIRRSSELAVLDHARQACPSLVPQLARWIDRGALPHVLAVSIDDASRGANARVGPPAVAAIEKMRSDNVAEVAALPERGSAEDDSPARTLRALAGRYLPCFEASLAELRNEFIAFLSHRDVILHQVLRAEPDRWPWLQLLEALRTYAIARERSAATLMGRWRSGASLVLSPDADDDRLATENDFSYRDEDPHGFRCPLGAHVRRTNPRDALGFSQPELSASEALARVRRARMLRRGRPYFHPSDPDHVGLHFVALTASIRDQFEFVMASWVQSPEFGNLLGSVDPIIGNKTSTKAKSFHVPAAPVGRCLDGLDDFVSTLGAGYFFLPSMAALRYLARIAPD
ncbi:MAG: hypothetical protein R3E87_18165 [Burkholderiaceae bacterium]